MMGNDAIRSHGVDNGKGAVILRKSLYFFYMRKKGETRISNLKLCFNFYFNVLFLKYTLPNPLVQQIFQNQPLRFQSRAAF